MAFSSFVQWFSTGGWGPNRWELDSGVTMHHDNTHVKVTARIFYYKNSYCIILGAKMCFTPSGLVLMLMIELE